MASIDQRKHKHNRMSLIRDVRPLWMRVADTMRQQIPSAATFFIFAGLLIISDWALALADLVMVICGLFFLWLYTMDRSLIFKLPMGAPYKDKNNQGPGRSGQAEGIMYLGNREVTNEEVWFTNSDIRTHLLYLGTTGAGKTEGLKSMVANAMAWGSGFVYVDGKADTDLWSSLSALVRRFGRDDDLLVLNYMTGNADVQAPSNTMNPFSSGSASYLTNMLVELMPESEGDNAMWKERAVSLCSAMMPALTWKRDNQDMPLSVRTIRDYLSLNNIVKLSRDEVIPEQTRDGLKGYLDTLPGYIGDAFDDDGNIKPAGPGQPAHDTTTANQQHGYLAMQFTRALQSLGDDYGYIFDTQAADVDMVDVVLNRRILVVLIPALEKSGDEIANLGKIVAATMKGMMGSALGSTVEGESSTVIENKPTHSSTPFVTVFDEVGYYTAAGMAVMAAQARSLGFSLVFAGQDLPALKKRVREEANSITANCNIKIFGKLEDPTETKEFFEKTVGEAYITEVSGFQESGGSEFGSYHDTKQAGVQSRAKATYDGLKSFKEGQACVTFGDEVIDCKMFYSNPGHAKAMRVTRFVALPPPDEALIKQAESITALRDLMVSKNWTAAKADVAVETPEEITALAEGFEKGRGENINPVHTGMAALVHAHGLKHPLEETTTSSQTEDTAGDTTSKAPDIEVPPAPMAAADTPKAAAEPTPPPVAKTPEKKTKLPPEILDIMSSAGEKTRKGLFKGESGNALIIILIGIVLFGALSMTISRSMRSETTGALSTRELELATSDILAYAQTMGRGVDRLRRKNISESDISFEQGHVAGYEHSPVAGNASKLFHPGGGAVSWQNPPSGANDGSPWHFTGATCIADIGTGDATCENAGTREEELLAVLPNLDSDLCSMINEKLGIPGIPTNVDDGYSTTKFTGSFANGTLIDNMSGKNAGCYTGGTPSGYHFYYVLIAR